MVMRKTILAVDSEQKTLTEVEQVISAFDKEEYEILLCQEGKKALELIAVRYLDLVITAIDVGDIDGLDILKAAKEHQLPVLVLTSRSDAETKEMIRAHYRPLGYLEKPLDKGILTQHFNALFYAKGQFLREIPSAIVAALFTELCSNVNNSIVILDSFLNVVWINNVLEKKGFSAEQIKGAKSYRVFANRDTPQGDHPTMVAIKTGIRQEKTFKGNDGNPCHLTSIPVKNRVGELLYVIEVGESSQG